MSLNNLSVDLASLGRREDALAAIEEAVTIRRELAARSPDAHCATSWSSRCELPPGLSTAKTSAMHPRGSLSSDNGPLSVVSPDGRVPRIEL